jgi:hypothetical protein
MSRGRDANRLYLVNAHTDDRDLAVAHADERRPPPLEAATRALARAGAQTSATDAALAARISSSATPVLEQRIADLTHEEATAQRRTRREKALADREARHAREEAPTPSAAASTPPGQTPERVLIADELSRRRTRTQAARTIDPPRYLVEALGPVPDALLAQRHWRDHAERIEGLRQATGFADPERALPDRVETRHRDEFDRLRQDMARAAQGSFDQHETTQGIER